MQSCSHLLHGRPGVPSLAAPPAGLGRPRSNTTYPAPARPPAPAVSLPSAADRRLGSPPKSPAACTHSRIFKNKQAPSPSRGVRRVFAKPAPPEAGKFAGRARAGRACCHPLLATRQPRRAPRPYSPPRERSPSLRVTPSPAMQCQDCTTLTHRLSSQLEKKKKKRGEREREGERQQRRRRTRWRATKDCTTRAGSAERPVAGRRARHGGEQEPALPLHQHNCLWAASPPAGSAPPTSCDQIRPGRRL